jgi:undecaprenyl-diphosphatase
MDALLADLIAWLQHHPHWAGVAVFVISCLESLLVVGLFVPGTVVMFGFGALVATGALELVPTLVWATLGAIVGDGVSFLIGRHFHQRLRVIWPFRHHPRLISRGVDFFHHHGGKSVVFARFVGPVRPILPAVAGMLDMPPARFFLVNVLSALLWAPAYLLPGLVFGASIELAGEIAGRLAALIVVLVAVTWFSVWALHRLFRIVQPHASAWVDQALRWSRSHPVIRPLAGALLDPEHPEARGLAILAGLLVIGFWLFLGLWQQATGGSLLPNLDRLIYHGLQGLRTPLADRLMVAVTMLADARFVVPFMVLVGSWMAWRGRWKAVLHWTAAAAGAALTAHLLKLSIAIPRPNQFYDGAQAYAFPSSHATTAVVVYGFLAVVIAGGLPQPRRWIPYSVAVLLGTLVGFSRLYLGAHWLSDVLAGFSLGLVWMAMLGIAFRRHPTPDGAPGRLVIISSLALAAVAVWHWEQHLAGELARYQPERAQREFTLAQWREQAWRELPGHRLDLEGKSEHPLDLQWAGSREEIIATLEALGWEAPLPLGLENGLSWLTRDPPLERLPVLPQVHDGRHEALRLIRYEEQGRSVFVLRLWPADAVIRDPHRPLWTGNVSRASPRPMLWLFTVLRTEDDFRSPLEQLVPDLVDWAMERRVREGADPVLLLWPAEEG